MKQEDFNQIAEELAERINHVNNGLCTVVEFILAVRSINLLDGEVAGLLCPFTGLRYPSKTETAKIDKEMEQTK